MKLNFKFTIFSIGVLNNLFPVQLASIASNPNIAIGSSIPIQLESSTATTIPGASRRMKPTYGSVPNDQSKPSLSADTTAWQVATKVSAGALSRPVAAQRQNQYYDLPDYGSTPVAPTVFAHEENTFAGEEVPFPETQETAPQGDLAEVDFIPSGETETFTSQQAVTLPSFVDQYQDMAFKAEIYDTDPQTAQSSYMTLRSFTSQETPSPAYFSTTTTTMKPTLDILLRDGVNVIQKAFRTRSTYPFFPGGCTPKKDPEPTETLMCGIAKCLQLQWTEENEKANLKFRATDNSNLMNRPKLINYQLAPQPVYQKEDTYYYMHQDQM